MRITLAVTALLAAAAGVAAHARTTASVPNRLELVASATHVFTLTGVPVTRLYPGAVRPVSVSVRNPGSTAITVTSLKGTVAVATNRPGCPGVAANLVVASPRIALRIPARKTRTAQLSVSMPRTVSDACQGATFRIALAGRGRSG